MFFPRLDFTFIFGNVPAGTYTAELNLPHDLNPNVVELVQTRNLSVTEGINTIVPCQA